MPVTLEKIKDLEENQVQQVLTELFKNVYSDIAYVDIKDIADESPEVAGLLNLNQEIMKEKILSDQTAQVCINILNHYASAPGLSSFVERAYEKVTQSDEMCIPETLISLGAIINLTLLVATIEVKYEKRSNGESKLRITKSIPSKDLVSTIITPLVKIVSAFSHTKLNN